MKCVFENNAHFTRYQSFEIPNSFVQRMGIEKKKYWKKHFMGGEKVNSHLA